MAIYLDGGKFELKVSDGQLILSERCPNKSRETGEMSYVSKNYKFFTQPEWLFLHLLRKKISEKDVNTFAELRDNIKAAERHVIGIAEELKEALKSLKQE